MIKFKLGDVCQSILFTLFNENCLECQNWSLLHENVAELKKAKGNKNSKTQFCRPIACSLSTHKHRHLGLST